VVPHPPAPDAVDGAPLELPPEEFVSETCLKCLHSALNKNGYALINVLADRATLETLTRRFKKIFGTVFVLCFNPNYLFYIFKTKEGIPHDFSYQALLKYTRSEKVLEVLTANICTNVIAKTATHIKNNCLLGWYDYDTFLRVLKVAEHV
jgi:hypothetical protein